MSGFKKLIIFLMSLFVLFCAYWAIGRSLMVKGISNHITDMQNEGYKVVHKGLSVGGFPLKFRARLSQPDITSPRSIEKPWSIKADDWRMEAKTYNPLEWTGMHRGVARIDLRGPKGERWLFDARPFNIDMTAKAGLNGNLKALDITGTQLKAQAVIGTLPPIVAMDEARLTASLAKENIRYDVSIENIYLNKDTFNKFQKIFGLRIEGLNGSALAINLKSLDNDAIKAWKKDGQITGEGWHMSWGGTVFQGGFDLTHSETGLSGIVRIELDDINSLISRLEETEIFSPKQARNAKLAAILLPVNQNDKQEITLTLRDGFLTLFGQKVFEF